MTQATPHTNGAVLTYQSGTELHRLVIGSEKWRHWLDAEDTTTFRFENAQGSFTARRENKSGGWYWYAYRKRNGKLRKVYLGKPAKLSPERLHAALSTLMAGEQECNTPSPLDDQPSPSGVRDLASSPPDNHLQDTPQGIPLLTTKLYMPPARPDLVARPRLLERLNAAVQRKLTLLSAPAGFGKTTLLSAWRAIQLGNTMPMAWVSLDVEDNDLSRFWNYVIASLSTIAPQTGPQVTGQAAGSLLSQPVITPLYLSDRASIEAFLTRLINVLHTMQRDIVLALDDYHLITLPPIHDSLAFLLDHLPTCLRLVILSRTDPPFSLVRLRTQGQLTELHAADLRFTHDEVTTFLNAVMLLDLSHDEIHALDAHTEGWVAGLQLAALSMQGREDRQEFITTFTGSHRHILEYLTAEVLSRQDEYIQNFLLQTSILDRLSPSLCNAVTNHSYSETTLEQLEQANLFLIPLNEQRRWYRYHHLFAEFLRAHLARVHPEMVSELHSRAAKWYEQNGFAAEAMQHMLSAGDLAEAARLVEQNGEAMVKSGEMMTLLNWFGALPEDEIRRRPRLSLYYAGALGSLGQLDAAEARVQHAEETLAQSEVNEDAKREVQGELASAKTFIVSARGDVQSTIDQANQALALLPPENAFMRSLISASLAQAYLLNGDMETASQVFQETKALSIASHNAHALLLSICCEAFMQAAQGRLHAAFETYRQTLQMDLGVSYIAPPEHTRSTTGGSRFDRKEETINRVLTNRPLPGASMAYIGLGALAYEWNRLDDAIQYLHIALELGQQWGFMSMLAEAYNFLALTHLAKGDIAAAFDVIEQGEQLIRPHNTPLALTWIQAGRARLWARLGNIIELTRWEQATGLSTHDTPNYLQEFEHLTLVRLRLLQSHYSEAEQYLKRLLRLAQTEGRTRSVIEMFALLAVSLHMQDKTSAALTALSQALELAQEEDGIRTFVDIGRPMPELLRLALSRGIAPTYARTLLAAFEETDYTRLEKQEEHPSLLSERELHVLRCIAAGKSNAEIARELVVAVSTIKTHINHMYLKLDVHSRTQAVARAKQLELIR